MPTTRGKKSKPESVFETQRGVKNKSKPNQTNESNIFTYMYILKSVLEILEFISVSAGAGLK